MTSSSSPLSSLKRRLTSSANEVRSINDYGRAALQDASKSSMFKGMFRSLDRYYAKFESTWEECLDIADAGATEEAAPPVFPTQSDQDLQRNTRRLYYEASANYEKLFNQSSPFSQNPTGDTTVIHDRSDLPRIPIPKFDGSDLLQWPNFRDTFKALVKDDDTLSAQRKFIYLRSAVSGSALAVIANLPTESNNFDVAWQSLLSAYDNKRVIASQLLNQVLNFKPIQGPPSIQNLKDFLARVSDSVSAFRLLAIPDESQFLLFSLAMRCLDNRTREQFETHNKDPFPTFDGLITFVRERVTNLELVASQTGTTSTNQSAPAKGQLSKHVKSPQPPRTNNALFSQESQQQENANSPKLCVVCNLESHALSKCAKFVDATVPQRLQFLRNFRGCRNCLSYNHNSQCPSKWNCRFCNKRHHSYLHLDPKGESCKPSASKSFSGSQNKEEPATSTPCLLSNRNSDVLLGTALAEIQDARGIFQVVRLVVDCGSQHSFISQSCLRRLGLPLKHFARHISGIGQTAFAGARGSVSCILRPKGKCSPNLRTDAVVIKNITNHLPVTNVPAHLSKKFANFQLADPLFFKSAAVDFLLGAELFGDIWTGQTITINRTYPKLYPSIFGHIVMGKFSGSDPTPHSTSLFTCTQDDDLSADLRRFWELEEPKAIVIRNPEEEQCEAHFRSTHYRTSTGQYVVRLPFKNEVPPDLSSSSYTAEKRFYNLEAKLKKNDELRGKYCEFMQEFIDLDHMSPTDNKPKYVIPHHSITKEDRNQTKIRVVFNGSAPTPQGSLNDHLLIGPRLQRCIMTIMLNFRLFAHVFVADIVKMFRAILVHEPDRLYQCIKWRFKESDALLTYAIRTVVYGLAPSPFLALRVLHQLKMDEGHNYPLAAEILDRDLYVDDFASGSNSLSTALELQKQLIELLHRGGFALSKWASNSPELLAAVAAPNSSEPIPLDAHEPVATLKILGVEWNPSTDEFSYRITPPAHCTTKREVLSNVAKIFDPLGLLAPTVFMLKSFIQLLWKESLTWDEPLPTSLQSQWETIIQDLPQLSLVKIPRHVGSSNAQQYQIVSFCDASEKGYCAAVYLRTITSKLTKVSLLIAKTRLAPVKTVSIPRLELCAALLSAELFHSLAEFCHHVKGQLMEPRFFSDSSIVLSWLHTPPYRLKTYVANRVSQISQLTPIQQWYHIDSEMNPSDCGSRGLLPTELVNHSLWFQGPPWLSQPIDQWPVPTFTPAKELPELKAVALITLSPPPSPFLEWIQRFSSFYSMLKVVSVLLRAMENRRNKPHVRVGPLTPSDINAALTSCITIVQRHQLLPPGTSKSVPDVFGHLAPFMDENGLWRVGGRIRHSEIPFNRKHPILLPAHSHFTILLIDHYHRSYLHPTPSTVQAMIQTKYWIVPSLRRLVRKRTFMCIKCFKLNAKPIPPKMGDLPEYRLQNKRAFAHTGVDFAGPFTMRESLRRKAATSKIYLALFVCMETKALHLEAVTSLTTEAFLAAFDRFTARRGLPSEMYSDCGLNFVGASNELRELYRWYNDSKTKEAVVRNGTLRAIKWNFNPPYAPHFGGLWESGVRSVKRLMTTSASMTPLTFEEYSTLFARFEAVLNSRPLCPLSSDPEECDFLSPGHFLVGGALLAHPDQSLLDVRENRLNRWQTVKKMSQLFWQRWNLEYLTTLQKRAKWTTSSPDLQTGTLVLIKDGNAPVMSWPLGRIVATHPGRDGVVRVVSLKKGASVFRRPVVDLVPLRPLSSPPFEP